MYYNKLKYTVISSGEAFEFDRSEDPELFLTDIKKGKISLEEAKNLQQDYEKCSKELRKGNECAEQKKLFQILTFFLTQEIMQSDL